jgi:hypothetical protein
MLCGIRWLFAAVITVGVAAQAVAIEENKSNLWFGGDEGIEVVWKTGENLPMPSRTSSGSSATSIR